MVSFFGEGESLVMSLSQGATREVFMILIYSIGICTHSQTHICSSTECVSASSVNTVVLNHKHNTYMQAGSFFQFHRFLNEVKNGGMSSLCEGMCVMTPSSSQPAKVNYHM